jgi:hypothetical protein
VVAFGFVNLYVRVGSIVTRKGCFSNVFGSSLDLSLIAHVIGCGCVAASALIVSMLFQACLDL